MIITNHQRIVSFDSVPGIFTGTSIAGDWRADVVDVSVGELVVDFPYYEVLWRLQPRLGLRLLLMDFKTILHTLENFQALLMPIIYLRQ